MFPSYKLTCLCLCIILIHSVQLGQVNILREKRQFSVGCILPPYPENGSWTLLSTDIRYLPGENVDLETIIQVSCKKGVRIEGTGFSICEDGKWSENLSCNEVQPEPTPIVRGCIKLESSATLNVRCQRKGQTVNCSQAEDGTIATFSCGPYYELDTSISRSYCFDGSWDYPPPRCTPECGINRLIGAHTKNNAGQGWHILIFKKREERMEYICMGTLISNNVIITAATCVVEFNKEDEMAELEKFEVAAGKYTRQYKDVRDTTAQYRKLKLIKPSPIYRGNKNNYIGNFAILVADKPFELNQFVRPVCIGRFNLKNKVGITVGFKRQSTGLFDDELTQVTNPYVEDSKCITNLPEDFLPFKTHENFCAGYQNDDDGICQGFGGSGLIAEVGDRNYFMGVASVRHVTQGTCSKNQYTLYTNVQKYEEFLDRIIVENSLSVNKRDVHSQPSSSTDL